MIHLNTAARQAKRLLAQAGFDIDKIDVTKKFSISVEQIAKKLGIKIIPHAFSDDISGVFFKKDGKLFLGVNKKHHENRQRFTIAHEIGHYILHSTDVLHYDNEPDLDGVYFRAEDIYSDNEREANHFAAELLMPSELIEKCIQADIKSISQLAARFNVSEEAMRYRLINLRYL